MQMITARRYAFQHFICFIHFDTIIIIIIMVIILIFQSCHKMGKTESHLLNVLIDADIKTEYGDNEQSAFREYVQKVKYSPEQYKFFNLSRFYNTVLGSGTFLGRLTIRPEERIMLSAGRRHCPEFSLQFDRLFYPQSRHTPGAD